ncbi:GrpB family protein [Actinopolymorpha pittospori]|uniref:GrpB-like predicted nucleotidyltransferase (UPF0157 family) n=1 Tax=Actinopolymorpha pittospori TaxID=648752 RepID=A0A927MR82_9ACTN|nr:GrpB family protein [Actinopolymorpha pittospori]MBE1605405.1 GrpB-like predicted nucleotidyltransferase (UPF0157 family) [Actinopolymorpha pittospori]
MDAAHTDERVQIVAYRDTWPGTFAVLGSRLRGGLGDVALRIDHIGSTSVPGLAAKPVIDIQISVAEFEPVDSFRGPLRELGFEHRVDNPDRTKRYFREAPGQRRTHIHVRRSGSFSQQYALLFRDYLRAHADAAKEYADVKRQCAAEHSHDREAYVEAKAFFVWELIRRADGWAQRIGWQPGPSDA